MDASTLPDDRNRLARVLLAAGLAVVSLLSFRKRKRMVGALAGLGAVGLAYSVTSETGTEIDVTRPEATAGETDGLRCAVCGEPIRTGQRRRPNENDEPAHETCLEAST